MKEVKVTQAFRNADIKCCLMIDNYGGRKTNQVVTQKKEVVDDLVRRKVAILKPVGYEFGDDEVAEEPESEGEVLSLDDEQDDENEADDLESDEDSEEDEGVDYSEMSWNDLLKEAKEKGVLMKNPSKEKLRKALSK